MERFLVKTLSFAFSKQVCCLDRYWWQSLLTEEQVLHSVEKREGEQVHRERKAISRAASALLSQARDTGTLSRLFFPPTPIPFRSSPTHP